MKWCGEVEDLRGYRHRIVLPGPWGPQRHEWKGHDDVSSAAISSENVVVENEEGKEKVEQQEEEEVEEVEDVEEEEEYDEDEEYDDEDGEENDEEDEEEDEVDFNEMSFFQVFLRSKPCSTSILP